jgi:hypothetical protein
MAFQWKLQPSLVLLSEIRVGNEFVDQAPDSRVVHCLSWWEDQNATIEALLIPKKQTLSVSHPLLRPGLIPVDKVPTLAAFIPANFFGVPHVASLTLLPSRVNCQSCYIGTLGLAEFLGSCLASLESPLRPRTVASFFDDISSGVSPTVMSTIGL